MGLSPQEFQEWIALFAIEQGQARGTKQDAVESLERFMTTIGAFLNRVPNECIVPLWSEPDGLYFTEHHDSLVKHPIPLKALVQELYNRQVISFYDRHGYVFAVPKGRERFGELSERLRRFREEMVRVPVE